MSATLSPRTRPIGQTQFDVLTVLKGASTGLVATAIRDAVELGEGDFGTRRAHAILKRLDERGYAVKETMSEKLAIKVADGGRKSKHRFKITAEGKKALKDAERAR